MLYFLFLAAISWLAGVLGGLTGTGGIIMPPLMMELFNVDPHLAMAMAQASYVLPSLLAVIMFYRKKQLDWRVAIPMTITGCVCTFLSAGYLKPLLNSTWLSFFFAACVILSGVVMLLRVKPMFAKPIAPPWRAPALLLLGAVVGLLSGITGSGANAVLVPAMVFMGLEILSVLGACQFFAVLSATSGAVGNSLNMSLDYVGLAWMIAGQLYGIWLGVRLAQRMDTEKLKRCVGFVCLFAGLFMMCKALFSALH